MANGHIEIHNPFPHHNGTDHEPKSTSDTESMEGTVEYRVLMAYATRRRPDKKNDSDTQASPVKVNGEDNADGDVKTPSKTLIQTDNEVPEKKKKNKRKKKKGLKRMFSILSCVSPRTKDEEVKILKQPQEPVDYVIDRCFHPTDEVKKEDEEESKVGEVVSRLMELADEIEFTPPELESDSREAVETVIGLLLRESGDRLDETVLKDANIAAELFFNYGFFRTLINTLLTRMGLRNPNPNSPGPQASPKTQMAVMCEVTTRLSAVETLPTNRLLNHGARYMQDYFSPWVQEQGGYEAAFEETEEID